MGTQIKSKGVDASQWATEVILPVEDGLKGAWFMRNSIERALINMAPGGVQGARTVGSPTISGDGKYGVFKSGSNFIQTELSEPAQCTFMAIFRAPTAIPPTQPESLTPVLFGNYTRASDPAVTPPGISVWCPSNAAVAVGAARVISGANTISPQALGEVAPATYNTWHAACVRVGPDKSYADDFTSGRKVIQAGSNARAASNTNKLRIASGYANSQAGDLHLAACLYWDRMLTDAEVAAMGSWLNNYKSLIGLTG